VPEFRAKEINQKKTNKGNIFKIPKFKIIFRVLENLYNILKPKNKAEEAKPWNIAIKSIPKILNCEKVVNPITANIICWTDEYAIKLFISICRKQIKPESIKPQNKKITKIF